MVLIPKKRSCKSMRVLLTGGVMAGMHRPLSIVIPIHSFEPGGVERVGLNLARYWLEGGHDVTTVLGRNEGADQKQAPELRYEVLESRVSTAAFETPWMIWSLFSYLSRNRADVIFCPGNTYAIVCVAMRILLGENCPPIVAKISNDLARNDQIWPYRMAYRLWLKIQGSLFDRCIGMAQPMRDEIADHMGMADSRIAIVPDPALSRERLNRLMAIPRPLARGPKIRFVAVGRLVAQKNFSLLLRAFSRGSRSGDTLTIVGDGPERQRLEQLSQTLGIDRQVTFLGHLPSPDEVLERSDCLVISSDYEGVPAVAIEAIAAGIPVITTNCSTSMADLVGYGQRGALVPVGKVEPLAKQIASARSLPQMSRGQRIFASRFVLEEACERYLSLMRDAVSDAQTFRPPPYPSSSL